MTKSIIITGIGGQGVVTAAGILRRSIIALGYRLTGSDNRGGAQRQGHVACVIRYSDEPERPLAAEVPPDSLDLLISLEATEGLKYFSTFSSGTVIVNSSHIVTPINLRHKRLSYFSLKETEDMYRKATQKVYCIDLNKLAIEKFKNVIVANLIALGASLAAAGLSDLETEILKSLEENEKSAFLLGKHELESQGK
ncbi:MAG: 2-oxoacid:acceptor oxidoreductase family protein [Candidatus Riflebacteria bacterium]|nr:2-oxoacid:acceptor oxidoreductase family protein [Candidatus Riflebacteria bacterium]